MKNVLVTGGPGFIGSHTIRALNARGIIPRVLIRHSSNLTNLQSVAAEFVYGDLTDIGSLYPALDGCDTLIHAAGFVSSRLSHRHRLMRDNAVATANILDAAAAVGVPHITVVSSVTGCGASKDPVIWEESMGYDLDEVPVPYFAAKRAAELILKERLEQGMPIVTVYPSYCLGWGDVYLSSVRLIVEFLKGNVPFVTDGGMGFLDVQDVAEALMLATEKGQSGIPYYLSGHMMTYAAFFNLLAALTQTAPPKHRLPRGVLKTLCKLGEPLNDGAVISNSLYMCLSRYWWFDQTCTMEELGWSYRPLEVTLRDTVSWLAANHHIDPVLVPVVHPELAQT